MLCDGLVWAANTKTVELPTGSQAAQNLTTATEEEEADKEEEEEEDRCFSRDCPYRNSLEAKETNPSRLLSYEISIWDMGLPMLMNQDPRSNPHPLILRLIHNLDI